MKTLLLGSGGRESALAWALSRSRAVSELVAAPGNPGIARHASLEAVDASDPRAVVELARRIGAGLVVVGPEAPLVAGVGDALRAEGVLVFGPDMEAARIEGSKSHAKELMVAAGIPTGASRTFTEEAGATAYMEGLGPPWVVKADGLAAGKGVVVTEDWAEAVAALGERVGGGRAVVIEEFLDGEEASLIAFSDGTTVVPCEPAQDYKRAFDDDEGPNTGGMGSYSPVPACPPPLVDEIVDSILQPMVDATAAHGAPFSGALYAGLALTSRGPKVIEFNARFGDPETQALLPRLDSDFGEVALATAAGELAGVKLDWSPRACVTVVLASGGYPGPHDTGYAIHGLEKAAALDGVHVFHAGTRAEGDSVVTAGGRVLNVSALGDDFASARERAYEAASSIEFESVHFRHDIGARAVERAMDNG